MTVKVDDRVDVDEGGVCGGGGVDDGGVDDS